MPRCGHARPKQLKNTGKPPNSRSGLHSALSVEVAKFLWIAFKSGKDVQAGFPRQGIGELQMHLRHDIGRVVQRGQLDIDQPRQEGRIEIEQTGSAIRAELPLHPGGGFVRCRFAAIDRQAAGRHGNPADAHRAGMLAAIPAMANRNEFWLCVDMVSNAATMAATGFKHAVPPLRAKHSGAQYMSATQATL